MNPHEVLSECRDLTVSALDRIVQGCLKLRFSGNEQDGTPCWIVAARRAVGPALRPTIAPTKCLDFFVIFGVMTMYRDEFAPILGDAPRLKEHLDLILQIFGGQDPANMLSHEDADAGVSEVISVLQISVPNCPEIKELIVLRFRAMESERLLSEAGSTGYYGWHLAAGADVLLF